MISLYIVKFTLRTQLTPKGDQGEAIRKLTNNLKAGAKDQVLFGVTGSGKTFTVANVIQNWQKPTLVISHNKTLAWQLYQEFKELFPENAVHYFVSYYDYYQPEAYIPQSDTYIAKDASINKRIDEMRHAAVQSLMTRKDVIVVASVSCIYNIGSPETYQNVSLKINKRQEFTRKDFLKTLVRLGFQRNDLDPHSGNFSAKGGVVRIYPASGEDEIKAYLEENKIDEIKIGNESLGSFVIYPANFWVTEENRLKIALQNIRAELHERLNELKKQRKEIEAYRLEQKTNYDLELIGEMGYCAGIENYSRHLDFRKPSEAPFTLINYFPKDFLLLIDESHMTIPQIRAMYAGDRARKTTLIEHGFRLPSALDNRPLTFNEFNERIGKTIYISATPNQYELNKAHVGNFQFPISNFQKNSKNQSLKPITYNPKPLCVVEQIVRPTGLLDPVIEVRGTENQMQNAIHEIKKAKENGQRTLVLTITKRLAEHIAEYLEEEGLKVNYIHSEIHTLKRLPIMTDFRKGKYDVLVGINLLREGLDFPEVSLVIIFDADKEGFLRNNTTLLQTIGRAARHIDGRAILYADTMTQSIRKTIRETKRRRKIQEAYNKKYGIQPKSIEKKIYELPEDLEMKEKDELPEYKNLAKKELETEMKKAAREMDFEKAAKLRDILKNL